MGHVTLREQGYREDKEGVARARKSWHAMRYRCTEPSNPSYPRYGGKGIKFADSWATFENFLKDMGPRPYGMSLDRFPNGAGNYEPGNCRWATPKQQVDNRGPSVRDRLIKFRGQVRTVNGWEGELGFRPGTLRHRLKRGWPLIEAMTTSLDMANKKRRANSDEFAAFVAERSGVAA